MSTVKNDQILLKIPETSFQSPALSQKHARNLCHTAHQYLIKFYFDRTQDSKQKSLSNFHYVAMPMLW